MQLGLTLLFYTLLFVIQEYAAWFNLGNVDTRINKFDDALVAYERASLLAPGIAGYRLKEALTLFQVWN